MEILINIFTIMAILGIVILVGIGVLAVGILYRLFFAKPEITEEDMFIDLWKEDKDEGHRR